MAEECEEEEETEECDDDEPTAAPPASTSVVKAAVSPVNYVPSYQSQNVKAALAAATNKYVGSGAMGTGLGVVTVFVVAVLGL